MFNHGVAGMPLPIHLNTDQDPLFRLHRGRAILRVLEMEEIKSVPYAPVLHPFVERLMGKIRRAARFELKGYAEQLMSRRRAS